MINTPVVSAFGRGFFKASSEKSYYKVKARLVNIIYLKAESSPCNIKGSVSLLLSIPLKIYSQFCSTLQLLAPPEKNVPPNEKDRITTPSSSKSSLICNLRYLLSLKLSPSRLQSFLSLSFHSAEQLYRLIVASLFFWWDTISMSPILLGPTAL